MGNGFRRSARARSRRVPLATGPWVLTMVLLGATLAFTLQAQRRAETTRRAWGDTVSAWVMERAVPAGATVQATDLRLQELPRALLPEGVPAATADDQIAGRVTLVALLPGEVMVPDRLGPTGSMPIEDLLRPDTVALPMPVSLLPWVNASSAPGGPVALIHRNGLVNGQIVSGVRQRASASAGGDRIGGAPEDTVLVVVPRVDAPTLVAALLDRQLVVALISAPPRSTG